MPDVTLELPDGDVSVLLDLLDGAVFANFCPGVVADEAPPARSPMAQLFGNRGPAIPLATWTPGEIGVQHAAGQRSTRILADRGCPVPEEWYVVSDHPKRGLVLRTYQSPPSETLPWLARAVAALCPVPVTGSWPAVVRTR